MLYVSIIFIIPREHQSRNIPHYFGEQRVPLGVIMNNQNSPATHQSASLENPAPADGQPQLFDENAATDTSNRRVFLGRMLGLAAASNVIDPALLHGDSAAQAAA